MPIHIQPIVSGILILLFFVLSFVMHSKLYNEAFLVTVESGDALETRIFVQKGLQLFLVADLVPLLLLGVLLHVSVLLLLQASLVFFALRAFYAYLVVTRSSAAGRKLTWLMHTVVFILVSSLPVYHLVAKS